MDINGTKIFVVVRVSFSMLFCGVEVYNGHSDMQGKTIIILFFCLSLFDEAFP